MGIPVACQCGFRKEVPDHWLGMRVQCKCGRSFVIGQEGEIMEPPVAAPPLPPPPTPSIGPPANSPSETPESASDEPPFSIGATDRSVAWVYRSRHQQTQRRRSLVLVCCACISLACLIALAVVLPGQFSSLWPNQTPIAIAPPAAIGPADSASNDSEKSSAAVTDFDASQRAEAEQRTSDEPSGGLSDATRQLQTRVAELVELQADDGLLLAGIFGDALGHLTVTHDQRATIEEIAARLKGHEEGLMAGTIELEQWYADGRQNGKELLAVLTDTQRRRLQELIEREEVKRVQFEDYAARLRPELRIPRVSWKIEADGARLPAIKTSSLDTPAQSGWYRATTAGSIFGWSNPSTTSTDVDLLQLYDLATDQLLAACEIPRAGIGQTVIIASDGQYLVVERSSDEGQAIVEVWSAPSGTLLASHPLPYSVGATPAPLYSLRDCGGSHVFAISGMGFWRWNVESDDVREVAFPDWIPRTSPQSAMSPGGRYVVVAHPHAPVLDAKTYHFLEICVYEVETGELLGNQILATDYREARVSAMALSHDGRELALLWDVPSPDATRMLLHLNAINGDLIRTVNGLPTSAEGYAGQHGLEQRDLIWLPDKSGWIVNLQKLVESESGAQIDIELPPLEQTAPPGAADPQMIVEAIPAADGRLLLIIVHRRADPQPSIQLKSQFIDLPKMGPFM